MALTIAYRDKKLFEAICRGHQWKTDQPEENGGEDKGPTPTEIFISSLGACVGIYILSYCKNTGLDATDFTLKLDWEESKNPSRISRINININLPKADIIQRKEALLRVAKKCLIHNTLLNSPQVDIEFTK